MKKTKKELAIILATHMKQVKKTLDVTMTAKKLLSGMTKDELIAAINNYKEKEVLKA